jgi:hypothetical protein
MLPDLRHQLSALKEGGGTTLRRVEQHMREVEDVVHKHAELRKAEWADWEADLGSRPRKWGTIQFELANFAFDRPTNEQMDDFVTRTQKAYIQALLDYFNSYFPENLVLSSLHRIFAVDPLPAFPEDADSDLQRLFEHYQPILHEKKDYRVLRQEYGTFLLFARLPTRAQLPAADRLQQWLTSEFAAACPNVTLLVLAALATPVSSAEAERCFSTMKRIKTSSRNRLGQQIMDDLMMISCNGPLPAQFPYEEAVYRWYIAGNRRVKLSPAFQFYLQKRFEPWKA